MQEVQPPALEYVSSNNQEKGINIPKAIQRVVFKNVVETSVEVCSHEGVWNEGVFMILAEGEAESGWLVCICARTAPRSTKFVQSDLSPHQLTQE